MLTYISGCGFVDTRSRALPTMRVIAEKCSARTLPLLLSFHYFKRRTVRSIVEQFAGYEIPILADSGGFSAMSLGERVSLAAYCRYIEENEADLEGYANLDVIGEPEKSARNFNVMTNAGLSPFPVFHVGSEWKYLDEILERAPTRLALGGMVPYLKGRQPELCRWLAVAFERIAERALGAMVHGFGVGVSMAVLSKFPWHSVDASSWTNAYQYRCIQVFDATRGEFVEVACSHAQDGPIRYRELLRSYGFTPREFYRTRYNDVDAGALALMSVLRAEQWVNERRKGRP